MSASLPPIGDDDIQAAVEAGVFDAQTADRFRAFLERRRATPGADEESFRLLTGFNDIFVAIALIMVFAALGWLGSQYALWLGSGLATAASWGLAEFFTLRRRMALPSILLLLVFVAGAMATASGALDALLLGRLPAEGGLLAVGALGVFAAFLHWRRFHVPITVAAGAVAFVIAVVSGLSAWLHPAESLVLGLMALCGLGVFALAVRWDLSDPLRRTRRADVAFWLHLTAAPLIVHPAFTLLGLSGDGGLFWLIRTRSAGDGGVASAGIAVAIYALLSLVALGIDRRALMVSALVYLLYAMNAVFRASGALGFSFAISALVAGAGLLLLSAYWAAARRLVLRIAPASWRARLPAA